MADILLVTFFWMKTFEFCFNSTNILYNRPIILICKQNIILMWKNRTALGGKINFV